MPRRIRIAAAFVALVALVALAYTQRVRLSETWEQWNRPKVPAVSYSVIARDEMNFLPLSKGEFPPKADQPLAEEGVADSAGNLPYPLLEKEGNAPRNDEEPSKPSQPPSSPPVSPAPSTLPSSFNLAVPFTPQAPFANWDEVHEEACEEASIYMAHLYYEGVSEGLVAGATAEDELLKIVEAEKNMFGYFEDTTAEETARFVREFYGHSRVDVIADPTVEDIKQHVALGHPVIVPAAGRLLGNPYFTPPGPVYHMLVIRGYTPDGFIVNDPGTKRGEAYFYAFDAVMNAMHDWNAEDITLGRKAVIVIYPNLEVGS